MPYQAIRSVAEQAILSLSIMVLMIAWLFTIAITTVGSVATEEAAEVLDSLSARPEFMITDDQVDEEPDAEYQNQWLNPILRL